MQDACCRLFEGVLQIVYRLYAVRDPYLKFSSDSMLFLLTHYEKQVRIHDSISDVRWAGALMEVRSLFGLNFAVEKTGDQPTVRLTDGQTDPHIESRVCD